ncbi:MAG: helix-turn-helix domain-containing protein [Nitrospirae bacterium]|nr:helix-turn-helix domain-containing protein [Nitrospirota bacterium]
MACNLYYVIAVSIGHDPKRIVQLKDVVASIERMYILQALEETNWIQARAAKRLGITQRMLGYKIKKYKIILKQNQKGGKKDEGTN